MHSIEITHCFVMHIELLIHLSSLVVGLRVLFVKLDGFIQIS